MAIACQMINLDRVEKRLKSVQCLTFIGWAFGQLDLHQSIGRAENTTCHVPCHACHGSSNNMHVHHILITQWTSTGADFYYWFLWEQSFRSSFFLSKYRNTCFFSFCLVCPSMLSCLILKYTILLLFLLWKFLVFCCCNPVVGGFCSCMFLYLKVILSKKKYRDILPYR